MDTCPPLSQFFVPLLVLVSDGEKNVRQSAKVIADDFGLTDRAKSETLKSNNEPRYINRTHWAATYLRAAGLIKTTKRGFVAITDQGVKFLKDHQAGISLKDHKAIPAFKEFHEGKGSSVSATEVVDIESKDALTPDERISEAFEEIESALAEEMLDKLINSPWEFFERFVIDLFLSMGYGWDDEAAGEHLGKSGDDGIDGLINQDALGLERVYIQAKRYSSQNTISSESVRSFIGALNVKQASKGLFVTTSSFSKSAISTAETVTQRIVLIDGQHLSRLMIKYNVGCSTQKTFSIKQLDSDYFE